MSEGLDYSQALALLKEGKHLTRPHWKKDEQFIFLIKGNDLRKTLTRITGISSTITDQVWIRSRMKVMGPFSLSNCDAMATDWEAY